MFCNTIIYGFTMEEHVIIASFGTSDRIAAESISNLEKTLKEISTCSVSTAYLSSKEHSIEKELSMNASKSVSIMPLLVQKGSEYERILSYGKHTGEPLLSSEHDAKRIAIVLDRALVRKENTSYLLIAHGQRERKVKEYEKLASHLRSDISLTFLMGPEKYTISRLPENEKIVIVPFLLVFGHHAKEDIRKNVIPFLESRGKEVMLIEKSLLELSYGFSEIFKDHFRALSDF